MPLDAFSFLYKSLQIKEQFFCAFCTFRFPRCPQTHSFGHLPLKNIGWLLLRRYNIPLKPLFGPYHLTVTVLCVSEYLCLLWHVIKWVLISIWTHDFNTDIMDSVFLTTAWTVLSNLLWVIQMQQTLSSQRGLSHHLRPRQDLIWCDWCTRLCSKQCLRFRKTCSVISSLMVWSLSNITVVIQRN